MGGCSGVEDLVLAPESGEKERHAGDAIMPMA